MTTKMKHKSTTTSPKTSNAGNTQRGRKGENCEPESRGRTGTAADKKAGNSECSECDTDKDSSRTRTSEDSDDTE